MSTIHHSSSENPTGRNRPYYGVWEHQFPSPTAANPTATSAAKSESTEAIFARQFPSRSAPAKASEPAHVVWGRQFNKPESTEAIFARRYAPKPATVPTSTAIARTFTASHKPGPSVSLGVRLSGIRGCAAASGIVDRIRRLIQSGTLDALIEAREEIERLPSDHAEGWKLVNELFDALGKLTHPEPAAT